MATLRELTYMVLGLLKETSDDAFYTEEHVRFLLRQMRSLLLERKYKGSRNAPFSAVSDENFQIVDLSLIPADRLVGYGEGRWLMSSEKIPPILLDSAVACTSGDMVFSNVSMVPIERIGFVGYNKWLKNIVYAARSNDGHLYVTSANPQFSFLGSVMVKAVFSDVEAVAKLSGEDDVFDMEFPLESGLVPSCIEMVVQELSGSRYAPKDNENNAHDDLGDVAVANHQATAPAERSRDARRNDE